MKINIYIVFILIIIGGCKKETAYIENNLVKLITPVNGSILDNGCEEWTDLKEWFFVWEDFPLAQKYHLYVEHPGAQYPAIDDINIQNSEYLYSDYGYVVPNNASGWTWKVRAFVNDEWTEWSEIRTFDVEPLNTDCD